MKTIQYDVTTKTLFPAKKYPLTFLTFSIKGHIFSAALTYFKYLEIHLLERRNCRQISSLVYLKYQYKCEQCPNRTKFQLVFHSRNCSAGFLPVYLSRGCCWICQLCYPGFVKSDEGHHGFAKCPTDSISDKNKTKCLKVKYQYFIIKNYQQFTAVVLSSIEIIYTLCFLAVSLFYKDTPIVKCSNLMLSVFQKFFT